MKTIISQLLNKYNCITFSKHYINVKKDKNGHRKTVSELTSFQKPHFNLFSSSQLWPFRCPVINASHYSFVFAVLLKHFFKCFGRYLLYLNQFVCISLNVLKKLVDTELLWSEDAVFSHSFLGVLSRAGLWSRR